MCPSDFCPPQTKPATEVRASVAGWLPTRACSANFSSRFVVDLRRARKRLRPEHMEPPRVVKLLAQAEEFQALIETGDVRSQADIAHLKGLSRARVTQIMNLLKLAPEIRDFIRELPRQASRSRVTERRLRELTGLRAEAQLAAAMGLLPGFRLGRRRLG